MEESWQLRGGMARPSFQWTNWQGPVNQIDLGAGRYPSLASQDISLIERTARQDTTFPHLLSLNSQTSHGRLGKSHAAHPMLALTQENVQPLQGDFQQIASSRMAYMVPNQMWYSTTDNAGWPLMTSGNPSFTGKMGVPGSSFVMTEFAQGVQGVDMGQISRAGGASKHDSAFSRQGGLELYKQALTVNPHLGEVDLHSQYHLPSWQAASSYIEKQAALLFKTSVQPVVEQAKRKPLQRPRVFCAGVSGLLLGGELTMSELGRLGVICACHNMHMSVAKFSEHAGLFAANPGSSVLLEGGESLVQWRKTFFAQFGVKVPEDHMGWEWDDSKGKEGDTSTQKVAYTLGSCKEPEFVLEGDCTVGKNSASFHSSMGFESSNYPISSAGMGLTYGDMNRSRIQNLGKLEPTIVEKSYKGYAGKLALSQKALNVTTRNQGTNSTHFLWGNEAGSTPVNEQASFAKVASQSSKRVIENSSAFSGKKPVELWSGRHTPQTMEQVENDLATSHFELRLGQPSQQNLSLGSIYSDPLQSRGSYGPLSQARPGSYELASQTGRPSTFDDLIGQGNGGIFSTNWLCSQKNRDSGMLQTGLENDKQLRNMHQAHSGNLPDAHTLQMLPNKGKTTEVSDAPYVEASYHSDIIAESSGKRDGNEQRRMDLSSSNYSTVSALNAYTFDLAKEADSNSLSHQTSPLLIRPMVKNTEAVRNVDGMFMSPFERPRPLMGPPEMNVAASEASMIKSNTTQTACGSTLTTWAKQAPCFANSESFSSSGPTKLHEGTSSAMICPRIDGKSTQQGLSVYTENGHAGEGVSLCLEGPAKVKNCTEMMLVDERSRDLKFQGVNSRIESSKAPQETYHMRMNPSCSPTESGSRLGNEGKTVTNEGRLVVEEQNLSEMAEEVCNHTELNKVHTPEKPATRAHVQDLKCRELSSDLLVNRYSSIEKVCLSDKDITRSDIDAEADSAGVEVTPQESPLSFGSPSQLEKASLAAGSENAKMVERRSSRILCGNVDSTVKELVRNDVLDEGSGIGKCSSSIEADMEVMTSTGPASSHAYVHALESQTSMANSSSSNAVISDTLSNSIRVRKLFAEVDKSVNTTQAEVHCGTGKSVQKVDKRGRKALKWKYPGVASSEEGEAHERISETEHRAVLRKTPTSDDSFQVPTTKGLKRKRSALSGSDLPSFKLLTAFTEGASREPDEAEHVLRWGGLKVSIRPPKDPSVKRMKETSLINSEKAFKPKRAKFQDVSSMFRLNRRSNLKASLALGKPKNPPFSGPSVKHGRGSANRLEVKSVKTASLSSILEVPKAGSQSKKVSGMRCNMPLKSLRSRVSETKFRQVGGLTGGGTLDVSAYCKGDANACNLSRLESRKRSSSELVARPNWQNNVSGSQTMVPAGKVMLVSQASDLEGKLVTVPLKFIAAKRLEPEVLRKESKDLLIPSANYGSLSGGPVKRLRSQVTNPKLVQYSRMVDTESKGFDDDDELKPDRKRRKCRRRAKSCAKSKKNPPLLCCICGETLVQTNNVIVKCCRCGLGVHQACYGVTELTNKPWICRPCKAHARNIVCVLCGYGGGAMTRARKVGALAKGLVQAWRDEDAKNGATLNSAARNTALVSDQSCAGLGQCDFASGHNDSKSQDRVKKDGGAWMPQEEFKVARSIVADGIDDPTVTQWVHVVCALWMPGTRCINVETMAAFDVSGVAGVARKLLCSICKRAGGACIKCRVVKCGTPFHPWCAHEKGLLQNEAFGGKEDKVGFFGKCLRHGNLLDKAPEEAPVVEAAPVVETALAMEPAPAESPLDYGTCARTEGDYKRGETSFGKKVVDSASLGVLLEDVTAWLSRKEHRRSSRRFIKLANSDVRTHHREYVRYKQEQGWKRLAVYKSSIHALGLYTSENITKGEMVVEYVGEVIGLRVADRREVDYLSNGRLQYRGACYLFRIDEENIIDATRKGGIARFVNHSCSPNCVAKIISVEKQKKVVFFAEKDIAAGEELTYDYKLDFETENRLPCYCKSAECRGFLN